jgi:hypothetical protein
VHGPNRHTELFTRSMLAPRLPLPCAPAATFSLPLAPELSPWCSSNSLRPTFARKLVSFEDGPDPAGDGDTLMYSCRLKLLPIGDAVDDIGTDAARSIGRVRVGDVGAGSNCASCGDSGTSRRVSCRRKARECGLRGEEGINGRALASPAGSLSPPVTELRLPGSLRNDLRSSGPGKRTRPLRAGLPLRLGSPAESLEFLSLDIVGRTGEGDVARKSIRSAASVSLGGCGVAVLEIRLLLALAGRRGWALGVVLPTCGMLCVRAWREGGGGVVERV